jgi:hypothetical protein
MRKTLFALFALLLTVPLLQAQPINSFVIDDFNNGPATAPDLVLDNQGVWASLFTGEPVLGQYRIIGNYITEAPLSTLYSATVVTSGAYSITNSAVTRSVGQVIWQGSNVTPGASPIIAHPSGFNLVNFNLDTLLSSPNFNFQWSVVNADDRNWEYTVRAYTANADNYYEAMVASNQSDIVLSLPRSAFTAVGNPDWTNINAITFATTHNDGLMGGDLAIDNITLAVPEPASWFLLGTVVVIAGYYQLLVRAKRKRMGAEIRAAAGLGKCDKCGNAFFSAKRHRIFCTRQ